MGRAKLARELSAFSVELPRILYGTQERLFVK